MGCCSIHAGPVDQRLQPQRPRSSRNWTGWLGLTADYVPWLHQHQAMDALSPDSLSETVKDVEVVRKAMLTAQALARDGLCRAQAAFRVLSSLTLQDRRKRRARQSWEPTKLCSIDVADLSAPSEEAKSVPRPTSCCTPHTSSPKRSSPKSNGRLQGKAEQSARAR